MNIKIELTQDDLRKLVVAELRNRLGDTKFDAANVSIEVKSKQNYKSEWEDAAFRAIYIASI